MSFRIVSGHEKQIAGLKAAIKQNRIPHAFLFYGMEGIGKRTVAMEFAKAVNCREGKDDSCDACPSCRKADHKNHPDIITIKAEGQFIKINAVRDLQDGMKFKPWEGGKRVCVIDDADRMNDAAANALLKTLEEPPPANIIILISSQPSQLPATILSRCRQIRFNPLSAEAIASFMEAKFHLDPQTVGLLAASAGGSIARAIEMQSGPYLEMRNAVMDMLGDGRKDDPLSRLALANRLGGEREDILERLGVLRACYRDAMMYKETGGTDGLINQDRMDIVKSFAERLSTKDIVNNVKVIDRAWRNIEANADKSLTLEVMMFRLV